MRQVPYILNLVSLKGMPNPSQILWNCIVYYLACCFINWSTYCFRFVLNVFLIWWGPLLELGLFFYILLLFSFWQFEVCIWFEKLSFVSSFREEFRSKVGVFLRLSLSSSFEVSLFLSGELGTVWCLPVSWSWNLRFLSLKIILFLWLLLAIFKVSGEFDNLLLLDPSFSDT